LTGHVALIGREGGGERNGLVNVVLNLRVSWSAGKLSNGYTTRSPLSSAQFHRVRRLWFQFPIRSLDFSIDVIFPAALWPRPVTEMSTSNLHGVERWPGHKADNLTVPSVSWLSRKYGGPWNLNNAMDLHSLLHL
jgi:hypothetical protein